MPKTGRKPIPTPFDITREEREAKWLGWCEGFDRHTTLTELWPRLRRATGGKTSRLPAHPQPEKEAERRINHFSECSFTRQTTFSDFKKSSRLSDKNGSTGSLVWRMIPTVYSPCRNSSEARLSAQDKSICNTRNGSSPASTYRIHGSNTLTVQ